MDAQTAILRACQHPTSNPCEVNMGKGERLNVCAACWNAGYHARRAARKLQLAQHWNEYREQQTCAMSEVGAQIGQRVQYFAASMLGLGGILVMGQIVTNRNGIAVVRLDSKFDGKRFTAWSKAWKLDRTFHACAGTGAQPDSIALKCARCGGMGIRA